MVIVESMKTEIAVSAPQSTIVAEILCTQSAEVAAGQTLVLLRMEVC